MTYTAAQQVSMGENCIEMYDALKQIANGEGDARAIAQAMIEQVDADVEEN